VVAQSAEPEPDQVLPGPRFPALDPEPPRRSRRGAALALTVTLAVAGGVTYAALAPAGSHKQSAATPAVSRTSDFSGIVLGQTGSGVLSLTDLRTGKEDLLKGLGEVSLSPGLMLSADDKFLIDPSTGKVFSLINGLHPVTVPNQLSFAPNTTAGSPWSDHDSYVVLLPPSGSFGYAGNGDATLQSVQTGTTIDLGVADAAAGDPQQAGAFFSVPVSGQPPATEDQPGPDSRLVLADAGAPAQVLATAAALNHILGFAPGTAVTLEPAVNVQGTMVAVEVAADNRDQSPSGVVVLGRSGQVLGAAPITGGGSTAMSWSADGGSLAYVSGADLVQWKIGANAVTRTRLPKEFFFPDGCVWSPDDSAVLCGAFKIESRIQSLNAATESWLVIASGRVHVLGERGGVLAWLTGQLKS
jgi:hypothetical protein